MYNFSMFFQVIQSLFINNHLDFCSKWSAHGLWYHAGDKNTTELITFIIWIIKLISEKFMLQLVNKKSKYKFQIWYMQRSDKMSNHQWWKTLFLFCIKRHTALRWFLVCLKGSTPSTECYFMCWPHVFISSIFWTREIPKPVSWDWLCGNRENCTTNRDLLG